MVMNWKLFKMRLRKKETGLLTIIDNLLVEIWSKGIDRYDPTDILSHKVFMKLQHQGPSLVWKLLRIAETIAPKLLRKIFRIEKTLAPTTLWHLSETYHSLLSLGYKNKFKCIERLTFLCDIGLSISEGSPVCWTHPYQVHGSVWRNKELLAGREVPKSCAHNTARLGLMYLRVGGALNNKSYIDAGISAAQACIDYHNWHFSEDQMCGALSYYPDTDDEVINTGADVAVLFMEAYSVTKNEIFKERARALLNMVLAEQEHDGGWRYCTLSHERRLGGSSGPDNHHQAMVIRALSQCILSQDDIFYNVADMLTALKKGVRFYLSELSSKDGFCYMHPGSLREANIAGYCEGLLALQAAQPIFSDLDAELVELVSDRRQAILSAVLKRFVGVRSARVISQKRFWIDYDIDSIRWGSGLFLEAAAGELLLELKNS